MTYLNLFLHSLEYIDHHHFQKIHNWQMSISSDEMQYRLICTCICSPIISSVHFCCISACWFQTSLNVNNSYAAVNVVMAKTGGQRRCKEESHLTAPWQHRQDGFLPRETLNPGFNSFGICMYVCLCERSHIDGQGRSTDIPNPCKLSGLMESVQLQGETFVKWERGDCDLPCVKVCDSTMYEHGLDLCYERLSSISSDAHSDI